ncbi:HupE/UreJ protein [Ancylobacter novellus DSM 506]|uniref:HupE/UreJ protein n=1 Tax=Ancylobacter novellus (strain ATCC 8093 / DSM 506 / JCM 20403 / CCM 1077 / IAM 12100 / NBRC 12443 / NCIMB 10456) TaxID=639283 RepID=D7A020_ANCN5|nr:HupE/UreJ family protein [Ancylobacter novellus]ADH87434.1 HupE/UreJ protein [Ancylobacter novellus DSM 506]
MSNFVPSGVRRHATRGALAALLALSPSLAFAHPGHGGAVGFSHGFLHPIGGLDHVLAMVAVGIFAANLGGRALWAVPATFVALMATGGALGMYGVAVPFVEISIAASVIVLGSAVALGWKNWPLGAAMALVGFFAVFHGHAHGAEMPADASALTYAAGFMLATALLHVAGIGAGIAIGKAGANAPRLTQALGAVVAVAGVGLLTGVI